MKYKLITFDAYSALFNIEEYSPGAFVSSILVGLLVILIEGK